MGIAEKAQLYRDRFPLILSERLASQVDLNYKISKDYKQSDLIVFAFNWFEAQEKECFWNAVRKLYQTFTEPSDKQIREVFKKYDIEP